MIVILHCVGRMLCKFQEVMPNNVTKVVSSLSEELTFSQVERDTGHVEQPLYAPDLFDVVRQ